MDVWVNFTNATRWQAEGLFKNFFPSKPKVQPPPVDTELDLDKGKSKEKASDDEDSEFARKPKAPAHVAPLLDEAEIAKLAKRFAEAIPEDEMSVRLLYRFFYPSVIFQTVLHRYSIYTRCRHNEFVVAFYL